MTRHSVARRRSRVPDILGIMVAADSLKVDALHEIWLVVITVGEDGFAKPLG